MQEKLFEVCEAYLGGESVDAIAKDTGLSPLFIRSFLTGNKNGDVLAEFEAIEPNFKRMIDPDHNPNVREIPKPAPMNNVHRDALIEETRNRKPVAYKPSAYVSPLSDWQPIPTMPGESLFNVELDNGLEQFTLYNFFRSRGDLVMSFGVNRLGPKGSKLLGEFYDHRFNKWRIYVRPGMIDTTLDEYAKIIEKS